MSVLHGYCVRAAGDSPPTSIKGVGGAAVDLLEDAGVGLWFSDVERAPAPELARLREHDLVIREALRTATPLPLRFGTQLADRAAAREMLLERCADFAAKLAEVAGKVEVGITVSRLEGAPTAGEEESVERQPDAPAAPAIRSGREYLEARRRELKAADRLRAEADAALDRVERALADLNLPQHRKVLPGGDALGMMAHLVQRQMLRAYRERFEELRAELPDLHLVLSGPWAPYSFV